MKKVFIFVSLHFLEIFMDKAGERDAFNLAYGLKNSWNVIETEIPDFLCERSGKIILGVEITQLWINETDARLNNIDGYVMNLLGGGKFVHKDDHSSLTVDKVKLIPADGDVVLDEVDALIQSYPTSLEKVAMLANAIAKKHLKLQEYFLRSPIVDLVVDDASMIFSFKEFDEVLFPISLSSFRMDIIRSQFREIFLITRSDNFKTKVSIPLKVNLLLEDILILEEIHSTEVENISIYQNNDNLLTIFAALVNLGYSDLRTCSVEGFQGLVIGAYTVHWSPTGKVLRDCCNWPEEVKIGNSITTVVGDFINNEVVQSIYKKRRGFKASCPILRSATDI